MPCKPEAVVAGLSKSPMPLSQVKVEGFRSADPPANSGILAAIACITVSDALRVAIFLEPAGNSVRAVSQSEGSSPLRARRNSAAIAGCDCLKAVSYTHLTLPTNREV